MSHLGPRFLYYFSTEMKYVFCEVYIQYIQELISILYIQVTSWQLLLVFEQMCAEMNIGDSTFHLRKKFNAPTDNKEMCFYCYG